MTDHSEEALRAEIEELRRQLEHRQAGANHGHGGHKPKRISAGVLWGIGIAAMAIFVVAFFAGYLPHSERETALAKESQEDSNALTLVNISLAKRSSGVSQLVLPGSIQAITEAPVLARASGYIRTRLVDIGDHVKEGQILAEIDAVELDQQVSQAKAGVEQAKASLEQANANLAAGRTNAEMARVTADRWTNLVQKGAVARQDADTYKAQYDAQKSTVDALEKAIGVARSNVASAESNLGRLSEMQSYLHVRAPFTGVITQRNVDTGALVNEGNTLLFRIAQTQNLRTYVNVPQADAISIHVGQKADVTIASLPSRKFVGTVTRTANSLDPSTRTLLAEVQVANEDALLLPGMYAQVNFTTPRAQPPVIIPGDTMVLRKEGPQVAVVGDGDVVHYVTVQIGRDFGDRMEALSGISEGARLVVNPGDSVRDGIKVKPVLVAGAGK